MGRDMPTEHLIADIPCKAFVERDGNVLFVMELDGKWSLPGGRINVGETPREALKREMREELGVEIEIGTPVDCSVFAGKSGANHFVVAFAVDILPGQELVPNPQEIAAVEWLDLNEVLKRTMHEGSRLIVERMVSAPSKE